MIVYDIETQDWDIFVLGAIYDGNRVEIYGHDEECAFAERLMTAKGPVIAHNGGRFDHLWLIDAARRWHLMRGPFKISVSSAGIVSMRHKDAIFLDSYRLYPMSLDKLTNGAKHDLSHLCRCDGKNCGGYCAIRKDMAADVRAIIMDYLTADVVELWKALDHFDRLRVSLQLPSAYTVAGVAWKSAQADLDLPDTPFESIGQWIPVRAGVHGGRVEVFKRYSRSGFGADVNSMYPAMLGETAIPWGERTTRYGNAARAAYLAGMEGIYNATVRVPESYAPPLPVKVKDRLCFPWGQFTGMWTRIELAYAESVGVRIEEIHMAIAWPDKRVVFTPWVGRLFQARHDLGKRTREGTWIKYIVNSLTGRLASRCEITAVAIGIDDPKPHDADCPKIQCRCGAHRLISAPNQDPAVSASTRFKIHRYSHPEWASYLLSAARIKLHKMIDESAVYCDTDGIKRENPVPASELGTDLGTWEDEGPYRDFEAIAPKVYRFQKGNGEKEYRIKGIPFQDRSADEIWQMIRANQPIPYGSMASLRRPSWDGRFFARLIVQRSITPGTGARIPVGDVETRAPSITEVRDNA